MKPTNDKRREIAARLRELADANEGYLGMDRMNRVLRDGQAILGTLGLASVADVLRRHADLIEPEPERTCKMIPFVEEDDSVFIVNCSECGDAIFARGGEHYCNFCPSCGAKVVGR